ncbi:hypothetical protein MKW94_023959 [Papaver nudicaule]|uniref:Biogenesis of lysosome-related organelles complex 1 subunit 7 n=1 Tax=Papaver nudicaule TaxID=74823 RepID=A0AA41S5L8_PAPNU|nr:hypothetical protein [Papaver nudicaule]
MNTPPKQEEEDRHPPPTEQTLPEPDEVANPEVGKILGSSSSNRYEESELSINKTSDALAKGISSILGSVIKEFDSRAQNTATSQQKLSSAIHRLTTELDQLLEDAPLPFIMQHASKISGVRKRVLSLNSVLKSIQRRIDNIDRLISTGVPNVLTCSKKESAQQEGNSREERKLSAEPVQILEVRLYIIYENIQMPAQFTVTYPS